MHPKNTREEKDPANAPHLPSQRESAYRKRSDQPRTSKTRHADRRAEDAAQRTVTTRDWDFVLPEAPVMVRV